MNALLLIAILGVLILAHEAGHFFVARWFGVRVRTFAIGFPPLLWKKKVGETTYKINALPFGGYVSLDGEENGATSNDPRAFSNKPKWQQALVMLAGIVMNVLLALVLAIVVHWSGVPASVDHAPEGSQIHNEQLAILDIDELSAGYKAGLRTGDEVLAVGVGEGEPQDIMTYEDFRSIVTTSNGETIQVIIERGSTEHVLKVEPHLLDGEYVVGVAIDRVGLVRRGFGEGIAKGVKQTWLMTRETAVAYAGLISGVFTGGSSTASLTGPVGLAGVLGDSAAIGIAWLLMLMAVISINLAILNLIPFPALDGGRVLFLLIEGMIGRPIPKKVAMWVNVIGFGLLVVLMIVVTAADISRIPS